MSFTEGNLFKPDGRLKEEHEPAAIVDGNYFERIKDGLERLELLEKAKSQSASNNGCTAGYAAALVKYYKLEGDGIDKTIEVRNESRPIGKPDAESAYDYFSDAHINAIREGMGLDL